MTASRRRCGVLLALVLCGPLSASASELEQPEGVSLMPGIVVQHDATLEGQVVDLNGLLHEGHQDAEAAVLIERALDRGHTVALQEGGGNTLYLFLDAAPPGDDPDTSLKSYVTKRVQVTGSRYAAGGLPGIVVEEVELLDPPHEAE